MKQLILGILLTLLPGITGVLSAGQLQYKVYHNARFDYSISYPAKILFPQGEATNGDGQRFLSKDGKAELIVYGSHNALDQTLTDVFLDEQRRTEAHPHRTVTYKLLKTDWFVVSGFEDETIFYQKTMLKRGIFKTFRITYPKTQKSTFDPITTVIAKSFRG
ncbi:MAG: hypothetical protein HY774_09390 [Acidobacteria bacterium]|nr:hypothetical protein [Acidobacteriota bacterium]